MTDPSIRGTGGVGNDELLRDYGARGGKRRPNAQNAFRIHNAIGIPAGAAAVLTQMIKDGDIDEMRDYLLAKGNIIDRVYDRFDKRLAIVCKYFLDIPGFEGDDKPIPGDKGIPSFRIIQDFIPATAEPQYWFELRVIIPIKDGEDGAACIDALHASDFAAALRILRDKANDIDARIPPKAFKAFLTKLYDL